MFLGTAKGLYEVGEELGVRIAGHEITSLASDDSGWWGIVDGREVWRSKCGGQWTKVALVDDLRAHCLLPTEAGVYIGTSEAHVLTLRGETPEPVRSFEETLGRETWYTPWGGPPDVRSMTAAPPDTVYANVHVGGVVRSSDGGASWEPTIDIHSDVHQVLFDAGSGLVLAASARGLGVSEDGGGSWRFDADGLHAKYLRAVAVADGSVLVSASTGPTTDRVAIYRKPLEGAAPFERCVSGLPRWFADNIDTHCMAASGDLVAFGTSDGSAYLSTDRGRTWTVAAEGLPPVRCVAIS